MSLVLDSLRRNNADFRADKIDSNPTFNSRTDFDIYDYLNGEIAKTIGPSGDITSYINVGMGEGIHSFIGKSGSGKTSLCVKLAGNIVKNYPGSTFYFRDAEKTTTPTRIYELTGWDGNTFKENLDYRKYNLNHDEIYNDIRNICRAKETLKDQIMIDTGYKNAYGKPVKIFPPDVYLIDSLPSLNPVDDDDAIVSKGGKDFSVTSEAVVKNVEGMRIAGSNKNLLVKVLDLVFKYNIRLVLINHIGVNTGDIGSNSRYIQKQMMYLGQNEKLPGGIAYLHQCRTIVRTNYATKLDDEYGPMIHGGTKNVIKMIKNKGNISGVPIELIFDQATGYNSALSSFNYLINRGYGLDGNPRGMQFKCYPNVTFTKKTFWEKLVNDFRNNPENPLLLKALRCTIQKCLFYDLILKTPDPNPNNWMNGSSTMDYTRGLTS